MQKSGAIVAVILSLLALGRAGLYVYVATHGHPLDLTKPQAEDVPPEVRTIAARTGVTAPGAPQPSVSAPGQESRPGSSWLSWFSDSDTEASTPIVRPGDEASIKDPPATAEVITTDTTRFSNTDHVRIVDQPPQPSLATNQPTASANP